MTDVAVPFADFPDRRGALGDEIAAAIRRVAERADFILGDELEAFEREFAAFVGVEHAVGVASGTAALAIALAAAGIGPGDEVIVPAHTYIASALAIRHAGAQPVFCDVSDRTGLIDLESAAAVTGERTAAVMPVHLYGQACEMDAVGTFAAGRGLAVIEDAAQAHGARWDGRRAGSFGLAAAFSFYPTKNLGGWGDGGMVCTDDGAVAGAARRLRNLGQAAKGVHSTLGFNERLDTVQAAILRVKLPRLEGWNRSRREVAGLYRSSLPDAARCLPVREAAEDVYHLFPIRVDERDAVAAALAGAGVGTGLHYSLPVHLQPPFKGEAAGPMPLAEEWARSELSLPIYPGLGEGEVRMISELIFTSAGDRAGLA